MANLQGFKGLKYLVKVKLQILKVFKSQRNRKNITVLYCSLKLLLFGEANVKAVKAVN